MRELDLAPILNPERIERLCLEAAQNAAQGVLDICGRRVQCTAMLMSPRLGLVLRTADALGPIFEEAGHPTEAKVELWLGPVLHHFEVGVRAGCPGNRLLVSLPVLIERIDRRLDERCEVASGTSAVLLCRQEEREVAFRVVDVSTGGVGVMLPKGVRVMRGELLTGWLLLASARPIPVALEVCHGRPLDDGRMRIGTKFLQVRAGDLPLVLAFVKRVERAA